MQNQELASSRRKAMAPLLLSALVFPGLGQLTQRRWFAGGFYAAAFAAAGVWFTVNTARVLFAYYRFAVDFGGTQDATGTVSYARVLIPFAVASLVYVANLADAFIQGRGR